MAQIWCRRFIRWIYNGWYKINTMGDNFLTKLQFKSALSFAGIVALVILIDFLFRIYINYNTAKKIYKENSKTN